jgi:hypothetical protein
LIQQKKNTEINFFLANFGSSQSYTHQFVFPALKKPNHIKKKKKPLQRLKSKAKPQEHIPNNTPQEHISKLQESSTQIQNSNPFSSPPPTTQPAPKHDPPKNQIIGQLTKK